MTFETPKMACKVSQISAEKYHHGTFTMEGLFFGEGQEAFQAIFGCLKCHSLHV